MSTVSGVRELQRAVDDPAVFAEVLIGEPLWPHQAKVARSRARIRCMLTGRQAGKSRTLAVLALHQAFLVPGSRTLVISAGEDAAKDLLAEVAALASAPLLSGSVLDELKAQLTLTTGSTIRSIPASQRQARGKSIDLLILDEACFIDDEIWTAAKYTMIARPGSRVVMTSTPWGRKDRFFAVNYRAGLAGTPGFEAWHWPSTVSPLVDRELLETWRSTSTDREYRAEVLAEWVDGQGAYFSPAELDDATRDFGLGSRDGLPSYVTGLDVCVGLDWGFENDANVMACTGPVNSQHPLFDAGRVVYWTPYVLERFATRYADFVALVVGAVLADPHHGLRVGRVVSETNGVGQAPTQLLDAALAEALERRAAHLWQPERLPRPRLEPFVTTAKAKQDLFGVAKVLLQDGRLLLPREPSLLRQLAALEFEQTESGMLRIAVPERAGHDDVAMAFALSLRQAAEDESRRGGRGEPGRYRWASGSGGR